jgi:hypothetical protein
VTIIPNASAVFPPSGSSAKPLVNYYSGRYYCPPWATATSGAFISATVRKAVAFPYLVLGNLSLQAIAFRRAQTNAPAGMARCAVFADNGHGAPGAVVFQSATITVTTHATTHRITTGPLTLTWGQYWLALGVTRTTATTKNTTIQKLRFCTCSRIPSNRTLPVGSVLYPHGLTLGTAITANVTGHCSFTMVNPGARTLPTPFTNTPSVSFISGITLFAGWVGLQAA